MYNNVMEDTTKQTTEVEAQFIEVDEAAKILGVNPRQIKNMIKAGKLRARDINASKGERKQYRVFKQDLFNFDNLSK